MQFVRSAQDIGTANPTMDEADKRGVLATVSSIVCMVGSLGKFWQHAVFFHNHHVGVVGHSIAIVQL